MDTAEHHFKAAQEISEKNGLRVLEARSREFLGDVQSFRSRYSDATKEFDSAMRMYEEVGDFFGPINVSGSMTEMYTFVGKFELARAMSERAFRYLDKCDQPVAKATMLIERAVLSLLAWDFASALSDIEQAYALFGEDVIGRSNAHLYKARLHELTGSMQEMLEDLGAASRVYASADLPYGIGAIETIKARHTLRQGDLENSLSHVSESRRSFQRGGLVDDLRLAKLQEAAHQLCCDDAAACESLELEARTQLDPMSDRVRLVADVVSVARQIYFGAPVNAEFDSLLDRCKGDEQQTAVLKCLRTIADQSANVNELHLLAKLADRKGAKLASDGVRGVLQSLEDQDKQAAIKHALGIMVFIQ